MSQTLLDAEVSVSYRGRGTVLDGFRLSLQAGEIFGLAGESGCGKSTFALATLGLLDKVTARVSGRLEFDGTDLLRLSQRQLRGLRGRSLSLVPQSPLASLNPRLRIGGHLKEAWRAHEPRGADWSARARETLAEVALPDDESFLRRYPRELSVGMAQRLLIALAVMHRPRLIVADEATASLDLITRKEVLELFARLSRSYGTAILFITHDLSVMPGFCQRVGVVDGGRVVECGDTAEVLARPQHEYTQRLMAALPRLEPLGGGLRNLARHTGADAQALAER